MVFQCLHFTHTLQFYRAEQKYPVLVMKNHGYHEFMEKFTV